MKGWLARPDFRGVDCKIVNGAVVCEIENPKVQEVLGGLPPMIGKLVCGDPTSPTAAEDTAAALRDTTAPLFTFYVYDCATTNPMDLEQRVELARSYTNGCGDWVRMVEYTPLRTFGLLREYGDAMVALGHTGVIAHALDT